LMTLGAAQSGLRVGLVLAVGAGLRPSGSSSHRNGVCCGPANSVRLTAWLMICSEAVSEPTRTLIVSLPSWNPITRPSQRPGWFGSGTNLFDTSSERYETVGRTLAPVMAIKASPLVTSSGIDDTTSM